MVFPLSKEEYDKLVEIMNRAEPYDDDDPILEEFDGDSTDHARMQATMARNCLREHDFKHEE
ncbi:MAG: hypothetical protein E7554_06280 [Ruminococcaceae bacterium]|nr:hypothetical protein [Oscillospiraceae bacterium]